MSATARELFEEADRPAPIAFEHVCVLAQQDLQISTGAVETIDLSLDEVVRRVEHATDRGEFEGRMQRVIAVPLDLEFLTATMTMPTDGKHAPRLPSWSALLVVDAFERVAGKEQADELRDRVATTEHMKEAYRSVPSEVRQTMQRTIDNTDFSIAR